MQHISAKKFQERIQVKVDSTKKEPEDELWVSWRTTVAFGHISFKERHWGLFARSFPNVSSPAYSRLKSMCVCLCVTGDAEYFVCLLMGPEVLSEMDSVNFSRHTDLICHDSLSPRTLWNYFVSWRTTCKEGVTTLTHVNNNSSKKGQNVIGCVTQWNL